MTINMVVLCSGGGRTVLNLLNHIEQGDLDATITLAIASRGGIEGVDRLVARGLDVAIARDANENVEVGDARVHSWIEESRPDVICLCGYLRLLELAQWMEGRVLNIHPALLPKYGGKGMYGMRVHQAVLDNNETVSGCTVHLVDEQYDHGPIVLQRTCEVNPQDTPQMLANRVFTLECEAYPRAVKMVGAKLRV